MGAEQAELPAGGVVRALPRLDLDPDAVGFITVRTVRWGRTSVNEVLQRHHARGLVVLHRGRLAYEWYRKPKDRTSRHLCYSVTKSFTGTLAALAVHEGLLDREAAAEDLVPELAGSGFAGATVGQLADMVASIGYTEDYEAAGTRSDDPSSVGFGDYLASLSTENGVRALLAHMPAGPRAHGECFAYATPVTEALGWILERTGGPYIDQFQERIWTHVGAEHGATLSIAAGGTPMLAAGLSMTTRDLARAGLVLAEGRLVPAEVVTAMRTGGDRATFARSEHYAYFANYAYRDQWWLPAAPTRPLSAQGIHGQLLWVDPEAELVVACHSGDPAASDERRDLEHEALCRALTEESNTWP